MINGKKIVDTFLFSEPHEADLLWVKFNVEDKCVDEWILQENHYTLQGEYKGAHAKTVLEQERFAPFLDKVTVITLDNKILDGREEGHNFHRENLQRAICVQHLLQRYESDTLVMVSDTDEMIDFSDDTRAHMFSCMFESNPGKHFYVGRQRYWYDYDNKCFLPNIRIPVVPVELLHQYPDAISRVRHSHGITFDAGDRPIAFEYSYVFKDMEDVWRKKCTYAHTNFTHECIEIALECNHWPRTDKRGESIGGDKMDFFEFVELTPENSPKFVRDNLDILKTNIVNPNYRENRLKRYGYETLL